MDGQIDEGRKKNALDPNLLDHGAAAKIAKLDLSSKQKKAVRSCSEVRSRIKRSPSSKTLPDRPRTVSSLDSTLQKPPHSFDFRFVASDDEIRQLLIARTCDEHQDVTVISHPDDLSQANLVTRLSISDDGRHALYPGKLFESSQPLTLVMDIRKLTSEELPEFNDLLDPDNPSLYDKLSQKKRPLGEHVSLLVLADPAQLISFGQCEAAPGADAPGADAPGADFWRRINRPGNTWQFNAQTGNSPSMDIDEVAPLLPQLPAAESATNEDNTLVIDCHLHSHWRHLLLGGPGVDQQGRIRHIPGKLELLRPGQRVILKGANWQDLAFEQTIRQMLAQQCFESNGKICSLPDNVQFYQLPVGSDELYSLFQSLSHSPDKEGHKEGHKKGEKALDKEHSSGNPIIINQSNISQWLNPVAIAPEGYAVPNTLLLEQVRDGGTVIITSPLTEVHWFCLLGTLQAIGKMTGLKPRLQVAHSRQQPKALGLKENNEHSLFRSFQSQKKVRDYPAFRTVTYQQYAQASHWTNQHQEPPLVIQINEQTGFSQLFDNIHITSEQKAHFGRKQSPLQEALTAGKPVVLRGLESNPTLQQLLEPLVVGQPLLVNGQLQAYPDARITLLWPESVRSSSSLFNSMVATADSCPEVDLWEINARRHGLSRTELPEQALQSLYKAFKTVPGNLCKPLPEMTEGLLNNLILAARRAQQVDQSKQLLPSHWRKAINSVITHGARHNPPVRDFLKVACWQLLPDKTPDEEQAASVDLDQLNAIINSAPKLDRAFVRQNFWQLTRTIDPTVFKDTESKGLPLSYGSPISSSDKKDVLDRLCALIVAHGPEEYRQAMAHQLGINPAAAKRYSQLAIRPSRQIKRLQDALACGWQLTLPLGQTRSDAIHALASDCFHIARTANSKTEGIERIKHRLSESMAWQGSADMPLSALARDLYRGRLSQKDRESRRLSRLHDRLTDSPVIFLQGETGTGKSYFSAKMANASGQASVISLGPSDSEQTLMKCWQWQEHADGDRSMVQQNRALMEWASTESDKDGEYITLVLDEANLSQAGLLASLNGLWEPQPCIYVKGHPVKVSPKHRVILTGNPDHYSGRQMDPALKGKLPRAYYPRLDQAFLRDRVVEPALVRHLQRHLSGHQINDTAHDASKSVMALWQYYQELLPEHEFTPRDLTDICSWVGWYLDRALSKGDRVTCEQINSLIQHSFRDVLGPEITATHQDALSALEIWFAVRYEPENSLSDRVRNRTLSDIQKAFRTVTKKIRPDFDTSGSAVCELAQQLGQDLNRCQQAHHLDRKHGGRQATLIEGPAGRGKDATLNLVIESVKQQAEQRQELMPEVFYLNACDCSWDRVCEVIQKAKVQGGIVVISEMNLIDSQHLEGELNDILAGDAHPGFHLFATINPPDYSGRKPLSPALKGRFRHLPIRQYNPEELQTIAEKVLPESSEGTFVAKKLTEKHCLLRAYLQQKNLPLQPTSLDLQNVAKAVTRGGDFTDDSLHQCLNKHYRLYLMAANLSLEELPDSSTLAMSSGEFDSELCRWFNQTLPGIDRPWLIRSSDHNSIDGKKHEIHIKTDLTEEEARAEIIKKVAQARWQASGLSLEPKKSDNILTRALYRRWQQRWFEGVFCQMGVGADSVFQLTEEEKQTLTLSASRPYLHEADRQISAWNANAVQYWPAFWHQMSHLSKHGVDDHTKKAVAIGGKKAPEKCIPDISGEQTEFLDRRTNYKQLKKSQVDDHKIFNTHYPTSAMYRCQAKNIDVSAEGDIEVSEISKNILGVETLTPERLPGPGQEVTLTSKQTLASFIASSNDGLYVLPSLTPDDYIVALRVEPDLALSWHNWAMSFLRQPVEPEYTLVRDRYTGLHTLFIPEAKGKNTLRIAYIVEPGKSGEKTAAKEFRRGQSTTMFDSHCSEGMKTVLDKLFETVGIGGHPRKIEKLLRTIRDTKDTTQRIKAITKYCQQFSGEAKAESGENFFKFLVTKRQGSCRHRVPVFIAFCRYFGIPCRQIDSFVHSFAEYSVDKGQTWETADFGGAPDENTEILSHFQPTRKVCSSSTAPKKFKELMKGADLAQQQTLAKACGMSLEKLNKALEKNSVLPETHLSIPEILQKLWQEKDSTGFSMSMSTIALPGEKALDYYREPFNPIEEAVKRMLSNNDEDLVIEQLRLFHSEMIDQGGERAQKWLSLIVNLLKHSNLTRRSVIHFAREALASGWLDPLPVYSGDTIEAHQHHELLLRLEGVGELKDKATLSLTKWYRELLAREKNSQLWRLAYQGFRENKGKAFFITHCHEGFSSFLEDKITRTSLKKAWTDEPKGIPNVERMLLHQPAFEQLNSGKVNHRPVIILGELRKIRAMREKAGVLFQRKVENSPNLKQMLEKLNQFNAETQRLQHELDSPCPGRERDKNVPYDVTGDDLIDSDSDDLIDSDSDDLVDSDIDSNSERVLLNNFEDKCTDAILQAFSHYLYEVTHSNGGSLTYCWVDAHISSDIYLSRSYGAHDPSSPEELFAMMSCIHSGFLGEFVQKTAKVTYLRQALNANNALVLRTDELTKIVEEFSNTVNLDSICDSLDR
ncbi:AAA family ATPase [Endozoicomonas sp. 8E]|uniref:AAA family ATPase n=1 Tax=Endozoicomonas sp. 8E TaxID=3035692 RepID=UPI002938D19F|nr:AAA family ATPase [Endozoicomonas sp. 8E]WOG28831.1 AAA family ATPase [Endozoicomonas sp. 8E]